MKCQSSSWPAGTWTQGDLTSCKISLSSDTIEHCGTLSLAASHELLYASKKTIRHQ